MSFSGSTPSGIVRSASVRIEILSRAFDDAVDAVENVQQKLQARKIATGACW